LNNAKSDLVSNNLYYCERPNIVCTMHSGVTIYREDIAYCKASQVSPTSVHFSCWSIKI